jgi:hypothetical protein
MVGLSLILLGLAGFALGQNQNRQGQNQNGQGQNQNGAPEIDPTQAVSALALLSGGIMVIRRKN